MVVDWKDLKILQGFTAILDGDANLDGAVDFDDLDLMSLNYYTVSGQTTETWLDGDFASVDPQYAFTAPDANLVNLTDLEVIADTWVNLLGSPPSPRPRPTRKATRVSFAPTSSPPSRVWRGSSPTSTKTSWSTGPIC